MGEKVKVEGDKVGTEGTDREDEGRALSLDAHLGLEVAEDVAEVDVEEVP